MRNRRRMFSKQFGFGRGMGRGFGMGLGFGRGRGGMDGTGPRAIMGVCPRFSQNNLTEYKQYLEEELKKVNSRLEENPV